MRRIILSVNPMKYLSCSIWMRQPYWLLWSAVAAFLICLPCFAFTKQNGEGAAETRRSVPWHLEDAELRFRIEKDTDYSQIPDVHLSDLKKSKDKRQWSGTYYRLNGKVYKKGITMSCPGKVTYKNQKQHRRFVALAGLNDRADSDMSVSFEVYADKRRLYRSEPITKHMPPVEINVGVPSTAKEIKLVTTGSDMKGKRRASLVNAGFLLKGKNPEVSYVKLYTPGFNARDFEAVVFTSIGQRVPSQLFGATASKKRGQARQGEPMEILFDNSYGSTIYFVYLVHKDKYKPMPSSWEPKAGVILETRYTNKNYPECKELSGLLKVWNDVAKLVDRSLVDNIHHSFPIHHLSDLKGKKPRLALYRYEGFFRIEKAGEYVFATASNWASYLLVDGNVVISWPGEHNYRAGIRGQKKGKISLGAGVHKLGYLNYSPWGEMFTLAAWQKPQEKLGLMARDDFLPVERFLATAIGYKDLAKDGGSFKWQISDDWRLDQGKAALVQMRFDVLEAKQDGYYSYRWKLDDGKIETGKSIEHVFLRPQMRTVTLEVLKGNEVVAQVKQEIPVHVLWEKIQLEPGNKPAFEKAISESNFDKLPIGDIVNLYAFVDGLNRQEAKQRVVAALMNRVDELVAESQHQRFCLELGQYLRSASVRQYEQALKLFTRLREKSRGNTVVRQHAMVSQAELLVQCFGKAQEALKILNQLEKEKRLDNQIVPRFKMAQAEALIALDQVEEAREILQNLQAGAKQPNSTKQEVKDVGLLRHARLLAENTEDPVQLDYAMEKIEAIIANDPVQLLMPNLNLIKLDVHLAREEYLIAFYLAERLNKLELSNYYRSEVLVRQIKGLCGIKAVEQAKVIYEMMTTDYPYSPAVTEAKKVIVETVVAGQKKIVPKVN